MSNRSLLLLFLCGFILIPFPRKETSVTFLDVGQGDGIYIETQAEEILIDCGSSSDRKIGENTLLPFLKSRGKNHIDKVFVTHADADHTSGIRTLLEEDDIRIDELYFPWTAAEDAHYDPLKPYSLQSEKSRRAGKEAAGEYDSKAGREDRDIGESSGRNSRLPRVHYLREGDEIALADGRLFCLYPGEQPASGDMNDQSLILLYYQKTSDGQLFSVLLTGDAGQAAEKTMLTGTGKIFSGAANPETGGSAAAGRADNDFREALQHVTILKLGHHGSSSSTCEELLRTVHPEYAVISYGEGNRYGHPHAEVTALLEQYGIRRLDTADGGAVTFTLRGNMVYCSMYEAAEFRY